MPVKKDETKTSSTTRKTPARTAAKKTTTRGTKTSTTNTQVASNARHIEENAKEIKNNSNMIHMLYGIIIVLLVIIAGLAFFVGTKLGGPNAPVNTPTTGETPTNTIEAQDITIRIIDDARCSDCQTDAIAGQLKALPFFAGADFIEEDFSDKGIEKYLQDNNITALPAVIINTNQFSDGGQITPFLQALPDGKFTLALGAKFDPFAKRSDNGFLIIDSTEIESIIADSYIDGNAEAKITWIEYSDLECPFCAKLHNEGTAKTVMEKYGEDVNMAFQHFPLDFHPNALPGAQALECIAEQKEDAFYPVIEAAFAKYNSNNFSLSGFYDIAEENWVDRAELEACVESEKYKEKAQKQMAAGQELFGITGTPGNVIINNETGEYEVISGAYPASAFEAIIDRMLK